MVYVLPLIIHAEQFHQMHSQIMDFRTVSKQTENYLIFALVDVNFNAIYNATILPPPINALQI